MVGANDRSAVIRSRLMRIIVTGNSGDDADTLEIVLDDASYVIEPPTRRVVLGVSLGYVGGELAYMGQSTIDERQPRGRPIS